MTSLILEKIINWGVPLLCTGLVALIFKPIWKDLIRGRSARLAEAWDKKASGLQSDLTDCKKSIQTLSEKIDTVEKQSAEGDKKSAESLSATKQELLNEIKANTDGVREAMLTIHLYNLIKDSAKFVENGSITKDEYDDYMQRYKVYKKLGGNGHLDLWLPMIEKLPKVE